MTFSGVASNFAGVPLRWPSSSRSGSSGVLTLWLRAWASTVCLGLHDLQQARVGVVYLYFQFPLMVLIIAPAIDGLRPEWREAAENMGASSWSTGSGRPADPRADLIGTMILLFGNAFGRRPPPIS
jgi:putative spermidine/putrescine transport system permease protein